MALHPRPMRFGRGIQDLAGILAGLDAGGPEKSTRSGHPHRQSCCRRGHEDWFNRLEPFPASCACLPGVHRPEKSARGGSTYLPCERHGASGTCVETRKVACEIRLPAMPQCNYRSPWWSIRPARMRNSTRTNTDKCFLRARAFVWDLEARNLVPVASEDLAHGSFSQ